MHLKCDSVSEFTLEAIKNESQINAVQSKVKRMWKRTVSQSSHMMKLNVNLQFLWLINLSVTAVIGPLGRLRRAGLDNDHLRLR